MMKLNFTKNGAYVPSSKIQAPNTIHVIITHTQTHKLNLNIIIKRTDNLDYGTVFRTTTLDYKNVNVMGEKAGENRTKSMADPLLSPAERKRL